jgi:ribonuclease D
MTITLHHHDLPDSLTLKGSIAVDTEAMGLNPHRDRLCLVQLCDEAGEVHLVKFAPGKFHAPNLVKLLSDPKRLKLFHFGRFDIALMKHYLGVVTAPVYCTKIASRLCRTYTDRHGFKDLCRELITTDISKQQQSSDWGAETLTPEQMEYAAKDVIYLHALKVKLDVMLEREKRTEIAQSMFEFLPTRALLDLAGWPDIDLFAHN